MNDPVTQLTNLQTKQSLEDASNPTNFWLFFRIFSLKNLPSSLRFVQVLLDYKSQGTGASI
jgi:hypothetical protein